MPEQTKIDQLLTEIRQQISNIWIVDPHWSYQQNITARDASMTLLIELEREINKEIADAYSDGCTVNLNRY